MNKILNTLRLTLGFLLWTIAISLLLLSLSTSLRTVHASQYIWVDTPDGGYWALTTPSQTEPAINENWADQHLNDPDTGFNNLELEID